MHTKDFNVYFESIYADTASFPHSTYFFLFDVKEKSRPKKKEQSDKEQNFETNREQIEHRFYGKFYEGHPSQSGISC